MDLVGEAKKRLDALPPPKNGQVRAVPDDRTIRYYAAKGLLDRPAAMRGRTALYGPRHLAQIVAIKRMQSAGHSLADIEKMWSELDDSTLSRISGVALTTGKRAARKDFWKQSPDSTPTIPHVTRPVPSRGIQPAELRVEVAPGVSVVVALPTERSISISPADVHAVRVAAAAVVTELANRGLIAPGTGTLEEEP